MIDSSPSPNLPPSVHLAASIKNNSPTPIQMKFDCPHCSQNIDAPDEFAGSDAICPTCEGAFSVPIDEVSENSQVCHNEQTKKLPTLPEEEILRLRNLKVKVLECERQEAEDRERKANRLTSKLGRYVGGLLGRYVAGLLNPVFMALVAIALTCIIVVYSIMCIEDSSYRPDFVNSFVENLDAKRDAKKAEEDTKRKDEVSSRYSLWENRDIISVEIIKPEKMQFGAAPTRRGLRPVVLFPTEHKTKYRVTYTRTDTIDYDPSHYGK